MYAIKYVVKNSHDLASLEYFPHQLGTKIFRGLLHSGALAKQNEESERLLGLFVEEYKSEMVEKFHFRFHDIFYLSKYSDKLKVSAFWNHFHSIFLLKQDL